MKVEVLDSFAHDQYDLRRGQVIDLPPHTAASLERRGLVRVTEVPQKPEPGKEQPAGAAQPSSASPVGQVSHPTTLNLSALGAKKTKLTGK